VTELGGTSTVIGAPVATWVSTGESPTTTYTVGTGRLEPSIVTIPPPRYGPDNYVEVDLLHDQEPHAGTRYIPRRSLNLHPDQLR
jgi:hypothetical protein